MSIEVVVLDWDGTVVDSEHYIVNSLRSAAESIGLPDLGHDRYKSIIGLGLREALRQLYPDLPDAGVEALRDAYASAFIAGEHDAIRLFDGVRETLDALLSDGVRLAVATGKSRRGLERALDASGLRAYFSATRCADETASKPDPRMLNELVRELASAPKNMLMVGDTEYDLAMAARAGMPSLGVSYGVHGVDALRTHAPLGIIDQFAELRKYALNGYEQQRRESFELARR